MPVIHTHVSVSTTPAQRDALKAAYGKAISAVPGKSEHWLMCPFEDNMPIYFAGDNTKPAAYVEVNVFGSSVPGSAWEKLTEQIMAALESELGVSQDRTYIRYTATTDWGWNGGNFQSQVASLKPKLSTRNNRHIAAHMSSNMAIIYYYNYPYKQL